MTITKKNSIFIFEGSEYMKKRIISAIVMLIITIPIIYYGGSIFRIGVACIGTLALKEILDLRVSHKPIPIVASIYSVIALLFLILAEYEGYSMMFGLTYKGIAILLLGLLSLTVIYKNNKFTSKDALFLIGSIILIGTSFNTMILVREFSLYKFLYLILIFILTDTFALFGGMLFGRHKLAPEVSPKKTIEGSLTGSIIGTIGASIFYHYLVDSVTWKIVLATLLLSIVGQIGDLIFSKLKRENNIKDFSNLIPEHGGILDRLDSTIAIMLCYLIIYNLF